MNAEIQALESSMKVKALAAWAGCKRKLAPKFIVPLLGPHDAYWDIFAGAMAVLLVKPISRIEVVNDLHGDITNLARIVQDRILGPQLYRRLRRVLFDQTIHRESHDALGTETDPFERAYLYFIHAWQAWGGVAGTKCGGQQMSIRYTNNGGHQVKRFHEAVASIPAWRRRLRQVTILNTDAFKLLDKIEDRQGVVVYVDPPYIENNVGYTHDFLPIDHVRLAQALHHFKRTRVVLSYYAHPMLDDLYPSWTRYSIEVTKAIGQCHKGRTGLPQRATEVLLVNEKPTQRKQGLFAGMEAAPC